MSKAVALYFVIEAEAKKPLILTFIIYIKPMYLYECTYVSIYKALVYLLTSGEYIIV